MSTTGYAAGTYEVWAADNNANLYYSQSSNHVTFTLGQATGCSLASSVSAPGSAAVNEPVSFAATVTDAVRRSTTRHEAETV